MLLHFLPVFSYQEEYTRAKLPETREKKNISQGTNTNSNLVKLSVQNSRIYFLSCYNHHTLQQRIKKYYFNFHLRNEVQKVVFDISFSFQKAKKRSLNVYCFSKDRVFSCKIGYKKVLECQKKSKLINFPSLFFYCAFSC